MHIVSNYGYSLSIVKLIKYRKLGAGDEIELY